MRSSVPFRIRAHGPKITPSPIRIKAPAAHTHTMIFHLMTLIKCESLRATSSTPPVHFHLLCCRLGI